MAAPAARRGLRRNEDVVAPPRIVLTSGEPAGIGPDLCVMLAQADRPVDLVVAADTGLLEASAAALRLPLAIEPYRAEAPPRAQRAGTLRVLHVPLGTPVTPGRLDRRNGAYVIALLDRACDGCLAGEFAALVTAPVQKSLLIEAGYAFSGHTEYLAARVHAPLPVMLLVGATLRVALVTTHLPLKEVPQAITRERLLATVRIVHADLVRRFGLAAPRITVLGLNPHAGESGHLGREEIEVIAPALETLKGEGLDVRGPLPADTAFTARALEASDVIVAMYHDQGLAPLKAVSFGEAVNVTLGLPIVRTSVDHGTALDLARSGRAQPDSLEAALTLAAAIAPTRAERHAR